MDDELKIVIKAVLDDNAEKELNSQLKNLNLEPISPKLKLDLDTSKSKKSAEKAIKDIDEIISKKVIKNPVSLNIFKEFGIKNKLDREEISKAVESYQNALKIGNKDEIVKSYEDLFAAIKGSFFNFTKSLEDHEQEFLNHVGKQKMYISPHIKSDLRKDNYKYYRQNLVGKLTTDPQKALSPDVLYSEIYDEFGGVIPHPDKIINDSDRFQIIADKIIELREKAKATYDEEDILWNIGSDDEIKKRINDILSVSNAVKETAQSVRPIIKNIKSDLVDMSDPHWRSIIENAPFDINEKPKRIIKVPFQIDLNNPDEVKDEMERIVAEFTKNKGKLVDYKVSTLSGFDDNENKRIERLSAAVIKYKNELGETITKQLQWQKIGQEIDQNGENKAIGFAENYAIYSQNIEKATEKQEKLRISTEKLENKLTEYKKSFDNLQIKADKSGVKLNPKNIENFKNAIDNKEIEKSRHLLSMLSKEWQGLNAAMVKDTPNTALENMNRYITKMPYAIEALEIKLKTLSNPSKELQDKVQNLKIGLENVYKSSSNDEKLANYGKLKQAITNVNAELTNQIKLQRELNQNANLVYDKQTFSNRIQVWVNQNAEAAKVFRNEIEKVKEQIENADKFKLTNLKKQFQEITTNAKAMGITSETIFEKIFGMFGKLSSMIFGGSFLIFAVNSLKEIYSYTNSNFVVTDKMTATEIQDMSKQLLERGKKEMKKLSQPSFTFSMELANFLFAEKFKPFINELKLGSLIHAEVKEDVWVSSILLEIDIDYDNPENFTMTFGNKFRLETSEWTFNELFNQSKTTNSVSRNYSSLIAPTKNGGLNDQVTAYMQNSLNAANQEIISSENQDISVGSYGIRGRKKLDDGNFDNHQLMITNNLICMTDDNWQTSKLALGNMNGNYGIVADTIVGKLIAGNDLTITNKNNSFKLDGSGATLKNASLTIESGNSKIIQNAKDGLKIQKKENNNWKNKFYADSSGDLHLTGKVNIAKNSHVGGLEITDNSIKSSNGNIVLESNGNAKIGALKIDGNNARFDGTIRADRIEGQIVNNQIRNNAVTGDKISNNTIAGAKLNYGTITRREIGNGAVGNTEIIRTGNAGLDNIYATHAYIDNLYVQKTGTFAGECKWTDGGKTSNIRQSQGRLILEANDALEIKCPQNSGVIIRGKTVIGGTVLVVGDFEVADGFKKHCIQATKHYGKRLINAYETAEYYYGDIGENETKNGLCQVDIDPIFSECVNLKNGYQVFLTPYGKGELFVLERFENCFVVCGDNMKFGWELKAKRKGFENDRLEEYKEN